MPVETVTFKVNPSEDQTRKVINNFQRFGWQVVSTQRCQELVESKNYTTETDRRVHETTYATFNNITFQRNRPDETMTDEEGHRLNTRIGFESARVFMYFEKILAKPREPMDNTIEKRDEVASYKKKATISFGVLDVSLWLLIGKVSPIFSILLGLASLIFGIVSLVRLNKCKKEIPALEQKNKEELAEYEKEKEKWNEDLEEIEQGALSAAMYLQKVFQGYGEITLNDIMFYESICIEKEIKCF